MNKNQQKVFFLIHRCDFLYCSHRQREKHPACRHQHMGGHMFCGSCIASWSLHGTNKNNASQSRSSSRQQPHDGGAVQPDVEPFLTISHRPSAPCGDADSGRARGCSRRPFLRSGKDCTGADRTQDFTCCHEAVL